MMSREFGSCMSGFFHTQIEWAADDCEDGSDEITRLWGKLLRAFYPAAYAIASSEAGDWGESDSIIASIRAMPEIKTKLRDIEVYLRAYEDVSKAAVEKYVDEERDTS